MSTGPWRHLEFSLVAPRRAKRQLLVLLQGPERGCWRLLELGRGGQEMGRIAGDRAIRQAMGSLCCLPGCPNFPSDAVTSGCLSCSPFSLQSSSLGGQLGAEQLQWARPRGEKRQWLLELFSGCCPVLGFSVQATLEKTLCLGSH